MTSSGVVEGVGGSRGTTALLSLLLEKVTLFVVLGEKLNGYWLRLGAEEWILGDPSEKFLRVSLIETSALLRFPQIILTSVVVTWHAR